MVHDGVGKGEIDRPVPGRRVVHAEEHVDPSQFKVGAHLVPWPEAYFNVQVHDPTDGADKVDIVSGGITRRIQEFVGGIGVISPRYDMTPRIVISCQGGGDQAQGGDQKKGGSNDCHDPPFFPWCSAV